MDAQEITFHKEIFNDIYCEYYKNDSRYLLLFGGAGSGKSVFAAQKLIIRTLKEDGHRFLLIRKVGKSIRNSQYRLLKDLIFQYNLDGLFSFSDYNASISGPNHSEIISTGADDVEKLKSIHGITGIWIEEATELRQSDFLQIDLRLRGKTEYYKQIILSFNPIDRMHWIKNMFFNLRNPEATVLKTTYKDNKFIDSQYLRILENLSAGSEDFHRVYTLGEWGASTGVIYPKWNTYNKAEAKEGARIYGIDFGFNNPSAVVECLINEKTVFIKELLYEKGLTNACLIEKLNKLVDKKSFIYADSAEPQRIEEIHRAGFNIHPADKSVKNGIDYVRRFEIMIDEDSANLIDEINSYCWAEDKNGAYMDEAVKENDHLLDAARYCIYTYGMKYLANSDYYFPKAKQNAEQRINFKGY